METVLNWTQGEADVFAGWVDADGPYRTLTAYWGGVQVTLIVVSVLIFLSSLDDLFIDFCYWRLAIGRGVKGLWKKPPAQVRLQRAPEKRIAIMVPAWQESEVIASMVANTIATFDYERFHIFVGVYQNDPETQAEVGRVMQRFGNVHMATVPRDGPTSKADCLNIIVQGILAWEAQSGESFDVFLMHDAEDVVHPFGLRTVNWFIEQDGMIQLPVLSMNRRWHRLVACHYMDEFAEFHTKDLQVRSAMAQMTPSAGVATAFARDAMLALRAENNDQPFNTDSLTEDYDVGHRLRGLGFTSAFVRYFARVLRWRKAWFRPGQVQELQRELVATKEFFPDRWTASVRQKSRWMLGISYMGWRQLGWFGDLANRYFLFRDRKALITAPTGALGYLIVLQYFGWVGLTLVWPRAADLPPLVDRQWVWDLILVNFLFLLNRVAHRMWFTLSNHGKRHVWLAPVRIVVSNIIGFQAFCRAMGQFTNHLLTGKPIAWDKTSHAFPSFADMQRSRGRIGDLLRFWNHVEVEALDAALAAQKQSYRPLGLLLVDIGAVEDQHLAEAFAAREESQAGACDAFAIPADVLETLKPRQAARCGVVPIRREGDQLELVAGEPVSREEKARIEAVCFEHGIRGVRWSYAPLSDLAFAVRWGWNRAPWAASRAQTEAMLRLGMIDAHGAERLWRQVRSGYVRLGDMLVRTGAISHRKLLAALDGYWAQSLPLGEYLTAAGLVSADQVRAALALQGGPPADMIALAVQLSLIDGAQAQAAYGETDNG